MKPHDYWINLLLSGILIVGTYQFYFFTQRFQLGQVRRFHFNWDERIPFWPSWAWVYSFLYYPAILYLNWLARDARHFTLMAFSYTALLFMQMVFFILFPVETPPHWREFNTGQSAAEKFLLLVQRFDKPSNCFPSMHVSVAMLTALHALPALGSVAYSFPVLIGLSCLFTKQHYMIDLPFGAVLGWAAFSVYNILV